MPIEDERHESGDEGDYCKDSVFASPHVDDLAKARRSSSLTCIKRPRMAASTQGRRRSRAVKVAPGIAPGQTLGFLGAVGGKPGNQQQNDASGVSESHKKHRRALFKTGAFNHSATHPWAKEHKRSPWCQLKWASAKGPATLSPISRLLRLEIIAARSIIRLSLALSTTTFPRT